MQKSIEEVNFQVVPYLNTIIVKLITDCGRLFLLPFCQSIQPLGGGRGWGRNGIQIKNNAGEKVDFRYTSQEKILGFFYAFLQSAFFDPKYLMKGNKELPYQEGKEK